MSSVALCCQHSTLLNTCMYMNMSHCRINVPLMRNHRLVLDMLDCSKTEACT